MVKVNFAKEEIKIPAEVKVKLDGKRIRVSGPKGEILKDFSHAKKVDIEMVSNSIFLSSYYPRRKEIALIGTLRSLINNMFLGTIEGPFITKLKIVYAHFPINVKVERDKILIENFIGERAPRLVTLKTKDVKVRVEKDDVIVEGIDKEAVGQVSADIRRATKIKHKDPRTFQDGIYPYLKFLADKEIWSLKF